MNRSQANDLYLLMFGLTNIMELGLQLQLRPPWRYRPFILFNFRLQRSFKWIEVTLGSLSLKIPLSGYAEIAQLRRKYRGITWSGGIASTSFGIAGEDLVAGDMVVRKEDGKFYKAKGGIVPSPYVKEDK